MAGMSTGPETIRDPGLSAFVSSRSHLRTIAWLRWRIFVNTLRGKGAVSELVVRILSYPLLALIVLGPSVGSGFAAWYFTSQHMEAYLAIPLWIIFFLWQFIGVSTSATGPNFDVATLTRFPLRYRDYLVIRLSFGLFDPPTLAGIGCLVATTIGIAVAAPSMAPWAALLLFLYAVCNVLFSRMLYAWLERWLAQRRTRELFTMLLLLVSLGIQFAAQFADRFSRHGHRGTHSPWITRAADLLIAANWFLPPGLTATSIDHMHRSLPMVAVAALAGLLAYTGLFLLLLNARLLGEFKGENLSEAPAASSAKDLAKDRKQRAAELAAARRGDAGTLARWLSPTVAALLVKEFKYLTRSGPKLYVLIMPVFMIVLISARTVGLRQAGVGTSDLHTFLFSSGCAYTQMIMVGLIYNSLGADGAGVQFYFLAPFHFRDVMLAKNILTGVVLLIEILLLYSASAFVAGPPPPSVTAATLAWCLFAFLLNSSIGNIRSLVSPKGYEAGKVRRQNVSGLNSLISLVVTLVAAGLGALMVLVCRYLGTSFWAAAAVFTGLAGAALALYLITLRSLDGVALEQRERLTVELCKK